MRTRIILPIILILSTAWAAGYAHADILIVDPVIIKEKQGATLNIGSIQPGETIELIISPNSGYGKEAEWKQAILEWNNTNKKGITTQNSPIGEKSIISSIQTKNNTKTGTYIIPLTMKGETDKLKDETYQLLFKVEKELVKASITKSEIEGFVNEPLAFQILVVNDSSAEAVIDITPTLPLAWASPQKIIINPHSFETITLNVTPRFAGKKTFEIFLFHETTGKEEAKLNGTLTAYPTLKDRYAAGFYGFPFYTISLISGYLTNALFSLLL